MLRVCLLLLCDPLLWQHVYNPQRLHVVKACITVSGTIERAKREPDGDFHIQLKLDPQFKRLLRRANYRYQKGDLVVEPICSGRIRQKDTLQSKVCDGFSQHLFNRTMIKKHVVITGSYVLDKEHHNWAEIHPVTKIEVIK